MQLSRHRWSRTPMHSAKSAVTVRHHGLFVLLAAIAAWLSYNLVTLVYIRLFPVFSLTDLRFVWNILTWILAFVPAYFGIGFLLALVTYPRHWRCAKLAGFLALISLVAAGGWPPVHATAPASIRIQLRLQFYLPMVIVLPVFLGSASCLDRMRRRKTSHDLTED